jgi:signal transduction histidine kinase
VAYVSTPETWTEPTSWLIRSRTWTASSMQPAKLRHLVPLSVDPRLPLVYRGLEALRGTARVDAQLCRTRVIGRRSEQREDSVRSLADELRGVVDDFRGLGLQVLLDVPTRAPDLSHSVCSVLRDAITEALTNAQKHSGASQVWVRVAPVERGIEISVEDHGVGFDPIAVRSGFGLANSIRGRLEEAGGKSEIQSSTGAGTVVKMWLPC